MEIYRLPHSRWLLLEVCKMKKILFLLITFLLVGCKTYIPVPEYHNVYVEKHDTLVTRDSIFQKDSVYMWMQGDTVWKEKYSVLYKDRWKVRIVYRDSIKVDSVRVPYPVERKQTAWERTMQNVGKISLILIVISICFILVYSLLRARNKIFKVL